jgi:hypothetical protein
LKKEEKEEAKHQWLMPINPSYSGGREQEDRVSKPAQANISKKPITKKMVLQLGAGCSRLYF